MKTILPVPQQRRVQTMAPLFAGLTTVGLILAGCVVESVYPFYQPKDIQLDPALVGTWVNTDVTTEPKEFWQFDRQGDRAYVLTVRSDTETNAYETVLFQLDQQPFLDLCPTNRVSNQLPLHYLLKVELSAAALKFQLLDYKWLGELLEQNPKALRHILVPVESGKTDKHQLVLTASPQELQAFIRQYLNHTNAFTEITEMKRRE